MSVSEFEGLAAVVTGGASGIGLATAEALADRGARVAVLDLETGGTGPAEQPAGPVTGFRCDVTDDAAVVAAITAVAERFGGIDIVVNNAGIGAQGDVTANSDEEWHRVLDVNVVSMVRVSRAALPSLRASAHPVIVNTCSVAATAGLPDRVLYSASKGAVLALTRAMAADHVAEGIRVNCVCPGTVDTPWVGRLLDAAVDPEAERAALAARQPTGRLVTAAEVAHAILCLASPLASATTGEALAVDGGMQALRLRTKGFPR
jgi:2-keto-3-deoxy-L-fuconate dehydrogenase